MLERRTLGVVSPKPHTLFVAPGKKTPCTEYVFTRDGFSSGYSMLYLYDAPTSVELNEVWRLEQHGGSLGRLVGEIPDDSEQPLARQHIQSWNAPVGQNLLAGRTALFVNNNCRVSVVRGKPGQIGNDPWSFTNGDSDELYFIYSGHGSLLTQFGALAFKKHDYVLIPRGIPYILEMDGDLEALIIEGDPFVEIPGDFKNPHGQLRMEAPYTHRDFRSPQRLLNEAEAKLFCHGVTLRNKKLTHHRYSNSPANVVGWDGSMYPMAFSILDYLPKTGKIHLPPNLHSTFRGKEFVVCSFVPRMVDYIEGAIPCPYPHANVHCDEIIYYVDGKFTSRKGINNRSISYHPAGLSHGPQPGNYFGSVGIKSVDELAVMVDTWGPIHATKAALGYEDAAYATSWEE